MPRGDPVHRRNPPYPLLGTVHIAWTLGDLRSPTPFRAGFLEFRGLGGARLGPVSVR